MPVYLITSASGIGRATALKLAGLARDAEDVKIFFSALTADGCNELQDQLISLGAEAEYRIGNLTDQAYAITLVRICTERFGRIDALFNVAGISGRRYGDGPVERCSEEGWRVTLDTNLTTQYRMCREAVSAMQQQQPVRGQRGVLLNMSSILALHPEPQHFDTAAYAASKGAIVSLTRTIAASCMRHGIRANAIAPALVRTAMSGRASEDAEVLQFIRERQPLAGDVMEVQEVADACVFLLTESSRAITGQCLEVDAGWGLN